MGSTVKSRQLAIYGSLLRLYPQSFQKRYSTTMEQTFADMLQAEEAEWGRTLLWTRALVDLPMTAGKEHLTNGKELYMNRTTKFVIAVSLAAIGIVGFTSFWEGTLHARSNIGVVRVTTAGLADAMQQDDFYSTYGNTAVLFTGKVANVKTQGNTSLVTFDTGRPYNVVCQFPQVVSFTSGQSASIAAPAGSAERQPKGVLLHDCLQN